MVELNVVNRLADPAILRPSLPDRPVIARQGWRDMILLHWAVPAASLRKHVPEPLEIDEHEGSAYVSLVAFRVTKSRPRGVPWFLGLAHNQANVRTYVRLSGQEPGIYILSANASSLISSAASQAIFGIPSPMAPIEHVRRGDLVEHEIERPEALGGRLLLRGEIGEHRGLPLEGTLDHFVLERYYLHVDRIGSLWTIPVRHGRWVPRSLRLEELEGSLLSIVRAPGLEGPPSVAHYSKGFDVSVLLPEVRLNLGSYLPARAA